MQQQNERSSHHAKHIMIGHAERRLAAGILDYGKPCYSRVSSARVGVLDLISYTTSPPRRHITSLIRQPLLASSSALPQHNVLFRNHVSPTPPEREKLRNIAPTTQHGHESPRSTHILPRTPLLVARSRESLKWGNQWAWKESSQQAALKRVLGTRYQSSSSEGKAKDKDSDASSPEPSSSSKTTAKGGHYGSKGGAMSAFEKRITDRLPPMPHLHRPSKEELLAAATGFWSRLRVRFKWFSIRSIRPYNMDEIVGFFSWIVLGHVLWIVLGTTTFFSLLIFAVNTVFAQGLSVLENRSVTDKRKLTTLQKPLRDG